MSENDKRIFELINQERSERIAGFNDIHKRIDQVLQAINKITRPNGSHHVLALFITVILSLGTIMQIQISATNSAAKERTAFAIEGSKDRHLRVMESIKEMDAKIKMEINKSDTKLKTEIDALKELTDYRINHLKECIYEVGKNCQRTNSLKEM